MTIDDEGRETMQRNLEASLGCLRTEVCQYNPQETLVEGVPEHKDEVHAQPGSIVESENSSNREASAPPYQGYNRHIYQQEFWMWSNVYPDIHKLHQSQWNNVRANYCPVNGDYPFPIENRIHYLPFRMLHHGYPHAFQFQEFQYFVVIDFEATCDKEKNPDPQEIIEFPSVVVNSVTGEIEAWFQMYVRPSYHQHLSDFCKELTGIQQIQVDRGVSLSSALNMHDQWLESKGIKRKSFAVVTWSNWDCRVMLESECKLKGIKKPPYFNRWINLKVPFQEVFGGIRCNLKDAVQLAGLAWEGRAHCGLDDAKNTARLLTVLMRRGFRFTITNSLMWQQPMLDYRPMEHASWSPERPMKEPVVIPAVRFHTVMAFPARERCPCCFCGVRSSKSVIRKPGPDQGRWFFGCGNWTVGRRAVCDYFAWASP